MLEDNGGRDITLMGILAKKMNFDFEPLDPLDHNIKRSRGSRYKNHFRKANPNLELFLSLREIT